MFVGVHFSVHIFLVTWATAEQKSLDDSLKLLGNIIFLYPSASIPDGPDLPFVLIAAFRIIPADIFTLHLTGCISTGVPVRRTLSCTGSAFRCFYFNKSKISLLIGKTPFCIFFVRSLMAASTFPLCLSLQNFFDVSPITHDDEMVLKDF